MAAFKQKAFIFGKCTKQDDIGLRWFHRISGYGRVELNIEHSLDDGHNVALDTNKIYCCLEHIGGFENQGKDFVACGLYTDIYGSVKASETKDDLLRAALTSLSEYSRTLERWTESKEARKEIDERRLEQIKDSLSISNNAFNSLGYTEAFYKYMVEKNAEIATKTLNEHCEPVADIPLKTYRDFETYFRQNCVGKSFDIYGSSRDNNTSRGI